MVCSTVFEYGAIRQDITLSRTLCLCQVRPHMDAEATPDEPTSLL